MLASYLLDIDISDAPGDMPEDRSIGFYGKRYHFSTSEIDGYFQCLDGSSFSSIAQQNAIVRGGELSTMGDVEINITSKAIARHIEDNAINLLGAKVSMAYILDDRPKRMIFADMLIGEFLQKDEISFAIKLDDSTFAQSSPAAFARPEHGYESRELSTFIGEEVWLPAKKLSEGKNLYNQGMGDERNGIPELEGVSTPFGLPTKNGKPAFPSSFNAIAAWEKDGFAELTFADSHFSSSPFLLGLEGQALEVYSGGGTGDKYKIINSYEANLFNSNVLRLDRPFKNEIIPASHTDDGGLETKNKIKLPSLLTYEGFELQQHPLIAVPLKLHPSQSLATAKEKSNLSFFRITQVLSQFYLSLWKNMDLETNLNARIVMPNGNVLTNPCKFEVQEKGDNYRIIACANSSGEKIRLKGSLERAARFCEFSTGIASRDGTVSHLAYVSDGQQVPCKGDLMQIFKMTDGSFKKFSGVLFAHISMYWRLDELDGLDIDSVSPNFSIKSEKKCYKYELYRDLKELLEEREGEFLYRLIDDRNFYRGILSERTIDSWKEYLNRIPDDDDAKQVIITAITIAPAMESFEKIVTAIGCNLNFPDIPAIIEAIINSDANTQNIMDIIASDYYKEYIQNDNLFVEILEKYAPLISKGGFLLSARSLLLDDSCTALDIRDFRIDGRESGGSQDAIGSISLADETENSDRAKKVANEIKSALAFSGGSIKFAKYLYLQIKVDVTSPNFDEFRLYVGGASMDYDYTVPLDKVQFKALRNDYKIRSPIQLATALCVDNRIAIDAASFVEAGVDIKKDVLGEVVDYPSIKVTNGDKWEAKLSELCRIANFSLFSDGRRLYAHYFPTDKSKEPAWVITEKDIVANSYDITTPESGYISTDYEFSVPTETGSEILNVSASENAKFPVIDAWELAGDWIFISAITQVRQSPPFIMLPVSPSASWYNTQFASLIPDNIYEISNESCRKIMRLLDMRRQVDKIDCVFEEISGSSRLFSGKGLVTIRPLKKQEQWKIMTGGYPIDYASAKWLHLKSKDALNMAKRHIKMDERYTKFETMAYTNPNLWLKNILNTVAHNTYAKTLVKFTVPLDSLPCADLPSLMLKCLRLEFGWFKKYPINGWLIGYSLSPANDTAEIMFLSSEAFMRKRKRYDENETVDQVILDESSEIPNKLIMEDA